MSNVTANILGKMKTNRISGNIKTKQIVSEIKKNAQKRFKNSSIIFMSRHADQILTINQLYKLLGKYSVEYFMNDSANRKELFKEMSPIMYLIDLRTWK